MRIGINASAGDHGPDEIIKGALNAALEGAEVVIYGREGSFRGWSFDKRAMVTPMETDSSLAAELRSAFIGLQNGEIGALVTPQRSRELLVIARHYLQEGVICPGLLAPCPTAKGVRYIIDVGATAMVSDPKVFVGWFEAGSAFLKKHLGIASPRVGLQNIAAEIAYNVLGEAHVLLQGLVGYLGYAEPIRFFSGEVDLWLTSGFVGNTVLKTMEEAAPMVVKMCCQPLIAAGMPEAAACLAKEMKKTLTYDGYLISPLVGLNVWVFRLHGKCTADQIAAGILAATQYPLEQSVC